MPCDTVQLNSIDVPKMNPALLKAALLALKASGIIVTASGATATLEGTRFQIRNGRMDVRPGYEHLADRVKVAYSRQCVFLAAKTNGWKLKETASNVFAVTK